MITIRDLASWIARLAFAAFALAALSILLATSVVDWRVKVVLFALAVFAWYRPTDALVAMTALMVIAIHAFNAFGIRGRAIYFIVLPVLVPWCVRAARERRAIGLGPVAMLVAVVLASTIVESLVMTRADPEWRTTARDWITAGFLHPVAPTSSLDTALLWFIGLGVYGLTRQTSQQDEQSRRRLLWAVAANGVAATAFVAVKIADASLRADSWSYMLEIVSRVRLDVTFADVNAAGSFFVLAAIGSLGLYRPPFWRQAATAGSALLCGVAVWVSGSKAALGAGVLVILIAAARVVFRGATRQGLLRIAAILTVPAALTAVLVIRLPDRLGGVPAALQFRQGFLATSGRMIAHAPVFGIGVGQYYNDFPKFAPAWLLETYPRENAHNNYLQIAAELGVVAAALFVWTLWRGLRTSGQALGSRPPWALTAGLGAFLVTCLTGHPLLVAPIALTFWTALGLHAGWRPPRAETPTGRGAAEILAIFAIVALVVSIPFRFHTRAAEIDLTHVASGVSPWSPATDQPRVRTVGRAATFYIPGHAAGAELEFQRDPAVRDRRMIDIRFDGQPANQVEIDDEAWHSVTILTRGNVRGFHTVELFVRGAKLDGRDERIDAGVRMKWIRLVGEPTNR